MKIAVGIPTAGRPGTLHATLAQLRKQDRPADATIVCGTQGSDVAGNSATGALVILREAGLPRQRNAIIAAAGQADVLVFFDDDFLADPQYLAVVERHFERNPRTVMVTGTVLADEINGPGLSPSAGHAILEQPRTPPADRPAFAGYGCNMAVRLAALRDHNLRFDERLPLYGWQEDVDLSRCLAPFGEIVALGGAMGVHLGVKLARGKGVRLGYSQVANPLYLSRKRQGYPLGRAVNHIARNMAMNLVRAAWPEPYIDRRGRLLGNVLALRDLTFGRMAPERVLQL